MIQIIPIAERNEKTKDGNGIYYIDNSKGSSMTEKYNYAIENIILKSDDDVICFRHYDTEFRTPLDVIQYQARKAFKNGAGVAGVIGTIELESSCTWWNPNRHINGVGYIIQGYEDGRENPMDDYPGEHDYLATVDGCCMFFPKRIFEEGLRFDENLKGYHFYDVDICCQILERKMKVATINIIVKHQSVGKIPADFENYKKVCFEKWNKKINHWPITRYTIFS